LLKGGGVALICYFVKSGGAAREIIHRLPPDQTATLWPILSRSAFSSLRYSSGGWHEAESAARPNHRQLPVRIVGIRFDNSLHL
jgi:hypothetical protein